MKENSKIDKSVTCRLLISPQFEVASKILDENTQRIGKEVTPLPLHYLCFFIRTIHTIIIVNAVKAKNGIVINPSQFIY